MKDGELVVRTAVLEHVVDNLHHTRTVLKNGNFGTFVQFKCSVQKTINWDSSIAINAIMNQRWGGILFLGHLHEDQFANTDVALCP